MIEKIKKMTKNSERKNLIVSIVALLFIVVAVIGITYAAFNYTGLGTKSNKVTTSTITMNYNEATNGITLTDAMPISDSDGKQLTGEGRTFTFTVTVTTGNNTAVGYEVSAVKDNTSTLGNNDVRIYLEKSSSGAEGTYSSVLEPTGFSPINATTEIGTPAGEMLLHSDSTTSTRTDYYILRMWVAEEYQVTDESKFFTIKVNVYGTDSHINTSGISLNKNNLTLDEGESEQLSATVLPDYATNKSVTWTSSNTNVAVVDSEGNVTAQSISGTTATATITARDANGHSASCVVTVNKPVPKGVEVVGSPEEIELITGGDTILEAGTLPANANSNEVEWTTSDSDVLDIEKYTEANASGTGSSKSVVANKVRVRAVGPGTATLTVKSATNPDADVVEISVEILDPIVEGITIDKSTVTLDRGDNTGLSATLTPTNSRDKTIYWSNSDSTIASISCTGGNTNSSGEIVTTSSTAVCSLTGLSKGTTTVTAKDAEGHTATSTITVVASQASSVSIGSDVSLQRTQEYIYSLSGTTSDLQSDPRDLDTVTWSVGQNSGAGATDNYVTLGNDCTTGSSTCTITASAITSSASTVRACTSSNICGVSQVNISALLPTSVTIGNKPEDNKMEPDSNHALSVNVIPAGADDTTVTWSSSDTSVATITQAGVINAISEGTTTITATTNSGNRTDSFTLNVESSILWLYNEGEEYTNITGGWILNNNTSYPNQHLNYGGSTMKSSNSLNNDAYSKIFIEYTCSAAVTEYGVALYFWSGSWAYASNTSSIEKGYINISNCDGAIHDIEINYSDITDLSLNDGVFNLANLQNNYSNSTTGTATKNSNNITLTSYYGYVKRLNTVSIYKLALLE